MPSLAPHPVARAGLADLSYVVGLQKRFSHEVGFLPRRALEMKINLGRVWMARENGEPAGFIHHGSFAGEEARLFQAAIQYDAHRRHLGSALVEDFERRAGGAGVRGISLRCLEGLDANAFWRAAGYQLLTTEPGAKGRLNVWGKRLALPERSRSASSSRFHFATRLHACPRCGQPTTDTWSRGARRWALCPTCLSAA